MTIIEYTERDFMRGKQEKVTIRFDGKNLVKLPCHCKYDPFLSGKDGNQVMVVKKIEVKNKDSSWSLYPSVTWLDGVEKGGQLLTRVLVKKTNEESFDIMGSTDGIPDGKLILAAQAAGIYTETVHG